MAKILLRYKWKSVQRDREYYFKLLENDLAGKLEAKRLKNLN